MSKTKANETRRAPVDGSEAIVPLFSGNELRCPAYPMPCSYIRLCDYMGEELVCWDSKEWEENPEHVMGAIIGAMNCGLGEMIARGIVSRPLPQEESR